MKTNKAVELAVVLSLACSGDATTGGGGSSGGSAGSTGDLSGTTRGDETSTGSGSGSTGTGTSSTGVDGSDEAIFLGELSDGGDGTACEFERTTSWCDIFAQDCPEALKCVPWANDGTDRWNATACVPIAPSPAMVGDVCEVQGSLGGACDDCEAGSKCWGLDPRTLQGTCTALCQGTELEPTCPDPAHHCLQANEGVLALCLPTCDPRLADPCGPGRVCALGDDAFVCLPAGAPVSTKACEAATDCPVGTICLPSDDVPGCDSEPCCLATCDATIPMENPACGEAERCTAITEAVPDVGACLPDPR